ncbi:MAG: Tol-Pal system beta propeller repeat protein TolB, partial [Myxococcales bacterium]
ASAGVARAEKVERPVLTLSGANFRPLPLAIAQPLYPDAAASRAAGKEIDETLAQDLTVSGLFELLNRKSFLADEKEGVLSADIKFARWQDVGAEGLIKVVVAGSDPLTAEFHLYNTVLGKEELKKRYSGPASEARRLAHQFADDVFTFYTREPAVFGTQLAFVRKVGGSKQVFLADWDGRNARQLTSGAMNLLPSWTANGRSVAFTSYRTGSPAIVVLDLATKQTTTIFKRPSALVTGASFSRDGKKVVFSMSQDDGNSHLWIADADGENPRRLTDGFGINSSPSFSPDGKQIAYVSNRSGNPQIYVIPASGGEPKRITFQGNYNQTPDWSPRGDLIAFTARDERNVFDIFTVDPVTLKITRLTQDQGNNEEPSFSPNGRLIAFTSTRTGRSHLYVMSADGNFQRQMSFGNEDAYTPAWGPFPAKP